VPFLASAGFTARSTGRAAVMRGVVAGRFVAVPDGQVVLVLVDAVEVERWVVPRGAHGRQLGGREHELAHAVRTEGALERVAQAAVG
jgi:hypothetical protein